MALSSMTLSVDRSELDGPIENFSAVVPYIESAYKAGLTVTPVTLTFAEGKFKKTFKERFSELEGHDIHVHLSQWFKDQQMDDHVIYYLRLDIGETLRYHYHGIVITGNQTYLGNFKARCNKHLGLCYMNGGLRNIEAYVNYMMGREKCNSEGVVINDSKKHMIDYLDRFILNNT